MITLDSPVSQAKQQTQKAQSKRSTFGLKKAFTAYISVTGANRKIKDNAKAMEGKLGTFHFLHAKVGSYSRVASIALFSLRLMKHCGTTRIPPM